MAGLPAAGLNSDNIATFMAKQLGTPLKGDMELHILGEQPIKVTEVFSAANTTTAAQNAGFTDGALTTIVNVLTKKKIHK